MDHLRPKLIYILFSSHLIFLVDRNLHISAATCVVPSSLPDFGLKFNAKGELRQYNKQSSVINNRKFLYKDPSYDNACNVRRYNALGDLITEIVYKKMEGLNLIKINLSPKDPNTTFVFATKRDFSNSKKLLILIHGAGGTRAGQWSRKLLIFHSLTKGSQLPYIEQAIQLGYDILVMNTNDNKRKSKDIAGSSTPQEHASTVWDKFITSANNIGPVVIVAHSYGGDVTLSLARRKNNFKNLIKRVAFTDSVHSFKEPAVNLALLDVFKPITRNWIKSKRPIDTFLFTDKNDVQRVSSGHEVHEWTSWSARYSVFKYINIKTLSGFELSFNSNGQLRQLSNDKPFKYWVSKDKEYCQNRYEALGTVLDQYVYGLMEQEGLKRIYLNGGDQKNAAFVFCTTTNLDEAKKLIVLIQGEGVARAGQWARSLIINDSLETGTQLPYIKEAKQLGYDVLVMNINDNERTINSQTYKIAGSETPVAHAKTVWQKLITPAKKLKRIAIVAHSYGGKVTLELATFKPQEFKERVFALAFTDSGLPFDTFPNTLPIFKPIARNWLQSTTPVNTWISNDPTGVATFSAGTRSHVQSSSVAKDAVLAYIEYKFNLKTKIVKT